MASGHGSSSSVVCAPAAAVPWLGLMPRPPPPPRPPLEVSAGEAEAGRAAREAREGCSVVAGCRGGRGSHPTPPPPQPASIRSPATPRPTCAPTRRPRAPSRYQVPGQPPQFSPPPFSQVDAMSARNQSQSQQIPVPRSQKESPSESLRPQVPR